MSWNYSSSAGEDIKDQDPLHREWNDVFQSLNSTQRNTVVHTFGLLRWGRYPTIGSVRRASLEELATIKIDQRNFGRNRAGFVKSVLEPKSSNNSTPTL